MSGNFNIFVAETSEDVIEALRIRRQVFVQEQHIPAELDSDGLDHSAVHVLCRIGDKAVATGRLFPVEERHGVLARIAVLPEFRGQGLGRLIVEELEAAARRLGIQELALHPHKHLERFYLSLGYTTIAGTTQAGEHELITMSKKV